MICYPYLKEFIQIPRELINTFKLQKEINTKIFYLLTFQIKVFQTLFFPLNFVYSIFYGGETIIERKLKCIDRAHPLEMRRRNRKKTIIH